MRTMLIGLSALALAGCTTTLSESGQPVPESVATPPVECDAARAESFVGQNGQAIAEQARTAAGARTVRVIAPGQAVTQDFRPDRLNVETDTAGNVVRVHCA
jgi:hypothetical protein